jgi:protein TonB
MNPIRNSGENLTELVFENKNKAYGAYALRASQGENVTYSVMTTALLFMSLALLSFWAANRGNAEMIPSDGNIAGGYVIKSMDFTPEQKLVEKKIEQKELIKPKTVSGQVEVTNKKVEPDPKTGIDPRISANPNPNGADTTGKTDISGDPKGTFKDPVIDPKKPEEVVQFVDKMPFMDNMEKFIRDNLKYPREAVDEGIEGIVGISFVVEKDGTLSDIKIINSIGAGCEQEAQRVVSIMPTWHPGILKGEIKRTQCNLPIRFRLK